MISLGVVRDNPTNVLSFCAVWMLGLSMAIHVGQAGQCHPAVRALSLAVGGGLLGGAKRHYSRVAWGLLYCGCLRGCGGGDFKGAPKVKGGGR